jgi:hypothetical protein
VRREYPDGHPWPDDLGDWKVSLRKDRATELFGSWTSNWADTGSPFEEEEGGEE